MHTVASAARYLGVTYHRIIYAIARRWLVPVETDHGSLLLQSDLDRYRRERM